jgi:hypothetical protein
MKPVAGLPYGSFLISGIEAQAASTQGPLLNLAPAS